MEHHSNRVFNWIKTNTLKHERKIYVGVSNALENATRLMWLLNNDKTVDNLVSLLCGQDFERYILHNECIDTSSKGRVSNM